MLRQLHIHNFALIDRVELTFNSGLTAITGETGSGKSILLGAFGLLLGERADSKSIRDPQSKCIVEASFDLSDYELQSFFAQADLDYDDTTTIRREIAPGGKSRAFINDTPVSLQLLKQLGERLVDIHSQHENSILGDRSFQFGTVDAFARNMTSIAQYAQLYKRFQSLSKELNECLTNEGQMRREMDFIRFQWSELEAAKLEEIHQSEWEQELDTLNNAEAIRSALDVVLGYLDSDSSGAIPALTSAKASLQRLMSNDQLKSFAERLESCRIELKDLHHEMESFTDQVTFNPARVEQLQEALNRLYALQHKHHVNSIEELIALRDQFDRQQGGYGSLDERIGVLRQEVEKVESELKQVAADITKSRKAAAKKVSDEVKSYFEELQLQHAELMIELTPSEHFNSFGADDIQFLFRANKGGQLLPVHQVASGGEISRVMLALKASISSHKQLPVLILDEIDQGVSGEAGKKIGHILKEMSGGMQVLTITHLPQIAAQANHHLKVYKTTTDESTYTGVKVLEGDDRLNELAEMLNGKSFSKAALENARELMR